MASHFICSLACGLQLDSPQYRELSGSYRKHLVSHSHVTNARSLVYGKAVIIAWQCMDHAPNTWTLSTIDPKKLIDPPYPMLKNLCQSELHYQIPYPCHLSACNSSCCHVGAQHIICIAGKELDEGGQNIVESLCLNTESEDGDEDGFDYGATRLWTGHIPALALVSRWPLPRAVCSATPCWIHAASRCACSALPNVEGGHTWQEHPGADADSCLCQLHPTPRCTGLW